jgi:hypothetical protein
MGLVITVEPAEEPVTLAEASLFMRYTGSLQNAQLERTWSHGQIKPWLPRLTNITQTIYMMRY